jgi:hypothetical protein
MNVNVLEKRLDDLTVIKGIKDVRQAWLREQLQVMTYADLAALSVEQIVLALRADGRSVARKTVEFWIKTAADLMDERVETAVSQPKPLRLTEWQPFASFVVEFQERKLAGQPKTQRTKVHYMEADEGMYWPDLAHAELAAWIKKQVGETTVAPPMQVEPVAERPLPIPEPIEASVSRLLAWQPLQATEPQLLYEAERPFWGYLHAEQPFSLTIELLLDNVPEGETAVAAELHARNLSTGVNVPLPLTMESLSGGQNGATAVLSEGVLPAGYYRFGLLLKQSQPRSIQFVELPQLQVV